jgi:hypothetical protein
VLIRVGVDYTPLHGKVMLCDADILLYRCASAAEKRHYLVEYPDGTYSTHPTAKEAEAQAYSVDGCYTWNRLEDKGKEFALDCLRTTCDSIVNRTLPGRVEYWLSGEESFRKELAFTKPYKGGRPERPKHYQVVRDALIEDYGATETEHGLEADDALGIGSTQLGEASFICTIDKDLDQCPGWKFNWVNDRVYKISKRDGDFRFYTQLLTGDSVDNVPGIDGIGPAGAAKLLEGAKNTRDLFTRVWSVYRDRCSSPSIEAAWEYLLEQSQLLYILREPYSEREGIRFYEPPYIPEEVVKSYVSKENGQENIRRQLAEAHEKFSSSSTESSGDLSILI